MSMKIPEDNVMNVSATGTNTTRMIRINTMNGTENTTNHILNKKRLIVHEELNVVPVK